MAKMCFLFFVCSIGLFEARMSDTNKNVCELYLTNHYIKNGKDFGNLGLDYETSRSFKVRFKTKLGFCIKIFLFEI